MLTSFHSNRRRVALGVGIAALTVGGVSLAWANVSGSRPTASFTPAASTESAGDVSGPCDEAENAAKPECVGTTTPSSSVAGAPTTAPTAPQADGADARTFDAAAAGTVTYRIDGLQLVLVAATPAAGWTVEVERGSGIELDLDFRSGARRVQVDVEFEDGGVRERVRLRDDAVGAEVETVNGSTSGDDQADDDRSGPDGGSAVEDRSGSSGTSGDDDPGEDGNDDDDRDDDDDGSDDDEPGEDRSGPSHDDDSDDS